MCSAILFTLQMSTRALKISTEAESHELDILQQSTGYCLHSYKLLNSQLLACDSLEKIIVLRVIHLPIQYPQSVLLNLDPHARKKDWARNS